MLRYLPLFVVLGLLIYCVIDVITTDRRLLRAPGKAGWLLIVLIPVIGAILWLVFGKPRRPGPDALGRPRGRVVAPDDDPQFLRELDRKAWQARRDAERNRRAAPPEPEVPEDPGTGQNP